MLGFAFAATPAVLQEARAQGAELAAQQRQYAALDRSIEPELFQAPDLHSPQVRKAAKAARDQPRPLDRDAHLSHHRCRVGVTEPQYADSRYSSAGTPTALLVSRNADSAGYSVSSERRFGGGLYKWSA